MAVHVHNELGRSSIDHLHACMRSELDRDQQPALL
jgi:hypothetical protein